MGRSRGWLASGILIGLLAGLGVFLLVRVLWFMPRTVTDTLHDNYRLVASRDGGKSLTFASRSSTLATAADIADAFAPAERINDPDGVFLRYQDAIVAVTSDGARGSRIYVDAEEDGYRRWYGYVGGTWGTYSGRGESFRGGGPSGGK